MGAANHLCTVTPSYRPSAVSVWSGASTLLRAPCAEDGPQISALIAECPPLDPNSPYCNLLQCTHFAATCVLAERRGRLIGWISAHRPPSDPRQIFVWQVAVHPTARGDGLAGRMLDELLARDTVRSASVLTTTITETNTASWNLFTSFARRRGLSLSKTPLFHRDAHFAGAHDTEWQAEIGSLRALDPETSQ